MKRSQGRAKPAAARSDAPPRRRGHRGGPAAESPQEAAEGERNADSRAAKEEGERSAHARAPPRGAPGSPREQLRKQRRAVSRQAEGQARRGSRRRDPRPGAARARARPRPPDGSPGAVVSAKAREDHHGPHGRCSSSQALQEDPSPLGRRCTSTTSATTRTWATSCASIECRPLSRTKRWRLVEILEAPVIQNETRLRVADNTGAREILCIRVHGRLAPALRPRRRHHRGHGQAGQPNGTVKKGEVVRPSSCARRRRSGATTAPTSRSTRTPR